MSTNVYSVTITAGSSSSAVATCTGMVTTDFSTSPMTTTNAFNTGFPTEFTQVPFGTTSAITFGSFSENFSVFTASINFGSFPATTVTYVAHTMPHSTVTPKVPDREVNMGEIEEVEIEQNEGNVDLKEQEKERIVKLNVFSNKIKKEDLHQGDHIYSWRHAYIYAHHGIYIGDGKVIHFTRGGGQEVGTGTVFDRFLFSSSPTRSLGFPCPDCGDQSRSDGVICSCLDCFLSGGELYLFQYGVSPAFFIAKTRGGTCTIAPSDPTDDVLHRAKYLLQNGFGIYSLLKNNCEDFAIYCKTGLRIITSVGVGRSGQAASFDAVSNAVSNAVGSSPLRYLTSFAGLSSGLSAVSSFGTLTAVSGGIYCIRRFISDIGVRRDVEKIPVERLVVYASERAGEINSEQEPPLNKED